MQYIGCESVIFHLSKNNKTTTTKKSGPDLQHVPQKVGTAFKMLAFLFTTLKH